MSSKLIFSYKETRLKPELDRNIYEVFGIYFGEVSSIPITAIFKKSDGTWTPAVNAVFDTGAGISLLPRRVSEDLGIDKYVPHKLAGISKKPECLLPVSITRIKSKILDSYGNESPEFDMWVALADRDDVPSILGMKDIINNFKFESDPVEKKLYLMWKE